MTKVGIIGATGYGGVELIRLLCGHPEVSIEALSSVSFLGQNIADIYPSLKEITEKELVDDQQVTDSCDVIFAALPHGLSQELAEKAINAGKVFIDLGADFRLESEESYEKWYDGKFLNKELQEKAVYGLPELFREKVKTAKLIANPGCYPTGAALGLAPVMKSLAFIKDSIIIDAKSGVTGAGRSPSATTHFPALSGNFYPYKIGNHRHRPEIEQTLSGLAGKELSVIFTPHLLPINRGILSTIYIKLVEKTSGEKLHQLYKKFYENEKFVRLLDLGKVVEVKNIAFSNYCDISLHYDEASGMLIIVTAIDNMVKGAAGQAIQNMNIICGFGEATGLTAPPPAF